MIYYGRNSDKTFPTNMLAYLVIHNCFITAVLMEHISGMKCQIRQFHFSNILFNKDKKKISDIYVINYVPLL